MKKVGAQNSMKAAFLAALLAFGSSGCALTYRDEFLKQAQAKGWTEDEQLAALAYSDRLYFLHKTKDGFAVNYSRLSKEQVLKKLDEALVELDAILDYKNEQNARFVEYFGLREFLEHEEEVVKAIRDRVRVAELHDQFEKLIGASPFSYRDYYSYGQSIGGQEERRKGYNIQQIFLSTDISKSFSFTESRIEEAKRRGALKIIEQARSSLKRRFDRKEPNPAYLDDPNNFIWKSKSTEVEFVSYKILYSEDPKDNNSNYIEGYRIVDGRRESKPAIRIFYIYEGRRGVFLLDADKEGETGFGLPDEVGPVREALQVTDLLRDDNLMNVLFLEKKERRRVAPKRKPIFVEIARVGEKTIDFWEDAPDQRGWYVPFLYKNNAENNYNVKLVFASQENSGENPAYRFGEPPKQIKYLKKEWTDGTRYKPSMGNVVEYYEMKPDYAKRNVSRADVLHQLDTKNLSIVFTDGTTETGLVLPGKNKFIEDEPIMIDYTEGQKRWRIKKEKGSPNYNKRKEISPAKEDTGIYREMEME